MTSKAKPINDKAQALRLATDFLTEIGIDWSWFPGARGFIVGVEVHQGSLRIDPKALVSNVLHEAGHLAMMPGDFRPLMSGNLHKAFNALGARVELEEEIETEFMRAAMQCSDPEVTAWAWAAGVHLGLAPELIITDTQYDNTGAMIRLGLSMNSYVGINGLSAAGFCAVKPGAYQRARGLPAFPELNRWLQRSFGSEFGPSTKPAGASIATALAA